MPWIAYHDDDREVNLLADLLHVLRAHRPFREQLSSRSDALRAEYGLWPRGADGCYGSVDPALSPADVQERAARMGERLDEEGFTEQAVSVLCEAGYPARRNEVGHVAIAYDGAGCEPADFNPW
jgi:hypothetical protein